MNTHRRVALLALGIVSGLWSFWIYFNAGPLAVSEAALNLLGDIFSLVQTSASHGQGESSSAPRFSLVPMPAVQEVAEAPQLVHNASVETEDQATWPGFSETYVVSLFHRTDRRIGMERIRQALPWLNWTYVAATPADDARIGHIHDRVRQQRLALARGNTTAFLWPADLNADVQPPHASLGRAGADLWEEAPMEAPKPALPSPAGVDAPYMRDLDPLPEREPLACASRDYVDGPPYSPALPPHMVLSRAKLACWHSHAQVLRAVAERYVEDDTASEEDARARDREIALILEDDVDVEQDLYERMAGVWQALPDEWDVLFLGHCWSNESFYAALPVSAASASTRVHPSHAPKCTHAYAMTRAGARRLVAHLRFAPFAYGRALDQAYAWLVLEGRVRSYSVVPSVVVQRKVGASDIDAGHGGVGSEWRESLEHGVF